MKRKEIKEMSVNELLDFLEKPRKRPLSKKVKLEIKNLIAEARRKNEEFADKLLKDPLYKLAKAQLEWERVPKELRIRGDKVFETYDPALVMIKMDEIVRKIHNKGKVVKGEFKSCMIKVLEQ